MYYTIQLYTKYALIVSLIAGYLLSGCAAIGTGEVAPAIDGQVIALQLRSTLWGMNRVVAGKPDAFAMLRQAADGNKQIVLSWALRDAWAFVLYNCPECETPAFLQKGNVVNGKTMGEFVTWLERSGWRIIEPEEIPDPIKQMLAQPAQVALSMAQSLPTFLVVPMGAMEDLLDYQNYVGGQEWH